jgi:hypothetical protein
VPLISGATVAGIAGALIVWALLRSKKRA